MMELNYRKIGDTGNPLIVCHGLFGMLDNWTSIGKALGQQFQVYLVDLRNHGRSPHTMELDYPSMARDLRSFIQKHDLEHVHLLGHSMGGKVVQQFLQDYEGGVESAIVVDIAMKRYSPSHESIFAAMRALPIEDITSRKEAQQLLSEWIQDAGVVQFIMKNIDRTADGYRWKLNIDGIEQNYDNILSEVAHPKIISVPTKFIKGERSNYVVENDKEQIRRKYSNVVIETINNAGHWVHAENATDFLSSTLDFLES